MDEPPPQKHRLVKPGIFVAALIVTAFLITGMATAVITATADPISATPQLSPHFQGPNSQPTPQPGTSDSICGLLGVDNQAQLTSAPPATWENTGFVTYPQSSTYGPAATSGAGFSYCFHHSLQGALFAAASSLANSSNDQIRSDWMDYFIGPGLYRDATVSFGHIMRLSTQYTHMEVAGFRVVSYDVHRASVDLAITVTTTSDEQPINVVISYDLMWQGGDWKLHVTTPSAPATIARTTDFNDFILWDK